MPNSLLRVSLIAAMALIAQVASASRLNVLLLCEQFPGTDARFVQAIKVALEAQGFAVKQVGANALAAELAYQPAARLLVLPNSACCPVEARQPLLEYLKAGGNLLTIGEPPLSP